jgi:hypothetical protein
MYEIKRFPHDGTVDADGHVLEPAWLWERYLEREYADRAIRIKTDADGLEHLELDGRPSKRTVKGVIGLMGAMGDENARPSRERRYMDNIPCGAGDPAERVALLDQENLQSALLYPTIQLLWECEVARLLAAGFTSASAETDLTTRSFAARFDASTHHFAIETTP